MFKVYPYKMGSRSARALAQALNTRCVYPDRAYRPRHTHTIVNWGSGSLPNWMGVAQGIGARILNHPEAVAVAGNKLLAFRAMHSAGVPLPDFTTDREVAQGWVDDSLMVVERHALRGHSGAGIAIKEFGQEVSPAPLYTKYMKKADEYRVHVVNGQVIDMQQKRKREGVEDADYQVRNHGNGWVYCRENLNPPELLGEVAVQAIDALGLDFGGVDIIYNRHHNQLTVLEVNTACGIEGTTLTRYTEAFQGVA